MNAIKYYYLIKFDLHKYLQIINHYMDQVFYYLLTFQQIFYLIYTKDHQHSYKEV